MQTILYIQGIRTSFRYLDKILERIKSYNFAVTNYKIYYKREEIEKIIELKNEVEKIIQEKINRKEIREEKKIIIMAHSMGGIIACSINKNLYKYIEKIITIGSPHNVPLPELEKTKEILNYNQNIANELPVYTIGFYFDTKVYFWKAHLKNSKKKNLPANHGTHFYNYNFYLKKILKFAKLI